MCCYGCLHSWTTDVLKTCRNARHLLAPLSGACCSACAERKQQWGNQVVAVRRPVANPMDLRRCRTCRRWSATAWRIRRSTARGRCSWEECWSRIWKCVRRVLTFISLRLVKSYTAATYCLWAAFYWNFYFYSCAKEEKSVISGAGTTGTTTHWLVLILYAAVCC